MPDSVLRVEFHWIGQSPGHENMNVLHFLREGGGVPWDLSFTSGFLDDLQTLLQTGVGPQNNVTEEVTLEKLVATILSDPPLGPFQRNIGQEGTSEGGAASPQVAALIILASGHAGRTGRGRIFQPGIAEEAIGPSGFISTVNAAGYAANWSEVLTAFTGDGISPCVFSRVDDEGYEVVDIFGETKVATQKRRNRY